MNDIKVTYQKTKGRTTSNPLGMREMQELVYNKRDAQYLLIKSPPASGKSRSLMFNALYKLNDGQVGKVIVSVPERSIGSSFKNTDLVEHGFYANWEVNDRFNLCNNSNESTVQRFLEFMDNDEKVLICTHATLRFAYERLEPSRFNDILLAIDEVHHVSADESNILGGVLAEIMEGSAAHVILMTGSFFRGDNKPILSPENEQKFTKVVYNYYQQLGGYKYLKTLGIGYHFYTGVYLDAIMDVLDTDKKTIIHIPSVNSNESTKEKHKEVDFIINSIGKVVRIDELTGVIYVERYPDKKIIKVADLVEDDTFKRSRIMTYLGKIDDVDGIDLIIALGLGKEGFDLKYLEHAITVGYRSSLTEIVQVVGRVIRDSSNKTHSQFTNLVMKPDAKNGNIQRSVDNLLKAITSSLLMEQVLKPKKIITSKSNNDDEQLVIKGFKEPTTQRVQDIIDGDIDDLKAVIMQSNVIQKALSGAVDNDVINKVLIPNIIRERYPMLSKEEVEQVRQMVVIELIIDTDKTKNVGGTQFIALGNSFVNIDDLNINLIDSINPFQKAFEVISKTVDRNTFKAIQDHFDSVRVDVTRQEAIFTMSRINKFIDEHKASPNKDSDDARERRMADVMNYMRREMLRIRKNR